MAEDDGWVDVAQPKPAADDGWVNVNAATPAQGGATIPQGPQDVVASMQAGLGPNARDVMKGLSKFPADFAQGILDFVKSPGTAYQQGMTPEQEAEFGLNGALATVGVGVGKFKAPRIAIDAIAPHVQEFEAGVVKPIAEQVATESATSEIGTGLRLVEAPEGGIYTPDQIKTAKGEKYFKALDADGNVAAEVLVKIDGKTANIEDILRPDMPREEGQNTLGGSDIRSILRQFKDANPEIEEITGKRVSGARMGGGYSLLEEPTQVSMIIRAKQSGLIGPDVPAPPNETPAASAQRAIPAASQQGDKITMTPAGEPIDAWEQRFNRYVDKTTTPDDFKTLVKDMASQSNNFPEARAGTVAPEMVAKVAEAAGLDSSAIDSGKLRTTFRTDDEIRTVTTLLKKLGDDVQSAAEAVRTDDSPESLAAFQASIIKRDYALEATLSHTAALRAEWGRSGNALQEILKAQKGEDALTGLLKDKGRSIDDLRDIARGLNGLDREQAAKVLTGMRGQAPHWFYWLWSQGLISGPFTHAKYVLANATYAGMERGIVTPLASIIGKAKQVARGDQQSLVTVGYHGTNASFEGFDSRFQGSGVGAPDTAGKGLFFSTKPETASGYAGEAGGNVKRVQVDLKKPSVQQFGEHKITDVVGQDAELAGILDKAKRQGKDGVVLKDINGEKGNDLLVAFKDGSVKEIPYGKSVQEGLIGREVDRVFFGETAAGHWGTIAAVPDAIKAAYQTIKTGMKVPLESEKQLHDMAIAAGEKPTTALSRAIEPNLQPPRPIPGIWGRILGSPGDIASSIHVAFKVLGERSNLEMAAYNKAAGEGLSPASADFWQRKAYHSLNPSEKALKDSVYQAYKDTFMQELGKHAKNFQQFTKKVPGMKWVFPFTHIPINLMKATYEYTPFAALDKDMRANIKGENGGRQQDLAIARMTVGSSVMAYFTNAYMQGKVTSNYPTDPNERKDWALQGKPANSIQIGERWVSFERFGPAGDLAQIGAAIGSIVHRFAMDRADPAKGTDEAISHAVWATANAAANTIGNEVGFQSLRNFMDAIEDEKKGGSFAAYQTTSMLPFSSLLTQTASFMDPHMRVAKSMVNSLYYRIPELRETLLPKRDPLYGQPMENPGYHDILRSLPIDADPVKLELERVNLHPTAPRDVIGGVKLTPEQYDRYQATAGPLVQRALTSMVNHPGWQNLPLSDRADTLRATISAMRQQAATAIQIHDPKLIQQGLQQRLDYITGKTNTPRPKRPPELMVREPAQLGIRG